MKKSSLYALSALIAAAAILSSCVGGRTEANPDRHPDKWKRQQMRHFYDGKYRRH